MALSESKNSNFIQLGYLSLGALVIAVLTIKEIIVYNEETLVLVSFIIFMFFAYKNVSDVVVSQLEDRSEAIKKEFDHYFSMREDLLSLLISYHNTRKMLSNEISEISHFSKNEVKHILAKRQKSLENNLSVQIQQKLRTILLKELSIVQQVQQETSHWFAKHVFMSFSEKNASVSKLKDIMIKEAINTLETVSKDSSDGTVSNDGTKTYLDNVALLNKATNIPVDKLLINSIPGTTKE